MSRIDKTELLSLLSSNGIEIDGGAAAILADFSDFLLDENEKYNLTAIREPRGFMLRHICDSLTVLPYIPDGARVLDVGSGAGFPAVPLAIVRPDVSVTSLDSTSKKTAFVNSAAGRLHIPNVKALSARAEELAHDPAYRGCFDIVTARAVSRMSVIAELSAAFVSVGGAFVAMKGEPEQTSRELADAENIISRLGLSHERTDVLTISDPATGETDARSVVVMKKTSATPAAYPRRYSVIIKG